MEVVVNGLLGRFVVGRPLALRRAGSASAGCNRGMSRDRSPTRRPAPRSTARSDRRRGRIRPAEATRAAARPGRKTGSRRAPPAAAGVRDPALGAGRRQSAARPQQNDYTLEHEAASNAGERLNLVVYWFLDVAWKPGGRNRLPYFLRQFAACGQFARRPVGQLPGLEVDLDRGRQGAPRLPPVRWPRISSSDSGSST